VAGVMNFLRLAEQAGYGRDHPAGVHHPPYRLLATWPDVG
jgi:hypothetical protein